MTPTTPKALLATNFQFEKQIAFYRGKVRDVYTFEGGLLAMVASDRISAFDVVLPAGIPFKGQVLNQIANYFLDATKDIVPNWKIAAPDPMVTIGHQAVPFKVEMVIRGNLTGHAWRTYQAGKRSLCGIALPEGLKENQYFDSPIITPTTKAALGSHDEDISREEILAQGIVSAEDYEKLEQYTHALFARGREMAQEKGLILVDTKYEFGKLADGSIVLIDEIHTPDSSRYFLQDGFDDCVQKGIQPKQLSKEFVRQWLIENGFQGKAGQSIPEMSSAFIESVSERYIDLFETITGKKFERATTENLEKRVENAIANFID